MQTDEHTSQTFAEFCNIDLSDLELEHGGVTYERSPLSEKFRNDQRNDPKLASYWDRARNGSHVFKICDSLLYRLTPTNRLACGNQYALVVPQSHEAEVIRLAHDVPFSGHSGIRKTLARVEGQFFFPKMKNKISTYIRSCHACQMTAPLRTADRQPLQPIPVMELRPFESITFDVVGEFPKTAKGNRYLITLICDASKWVHAIPVSNLRAQTVADKLVEYFSFVGIPQILRCDNFSSFHSEILDALRAKLGIEAKFSSPYHPQSHGNVERLNRSITHMLRKFISETGKNWDTLIPYLLFALRELPNESTLVSPSELIFGKKMRGLMSVARDNWTDGDRLERKLNISTVKYIEELNSRIETAIRTARANVNVAQDKMKTNYDKKSTPRSLQPGELALILIPSDGRKLLATWRGPYTVLKRLSDNNYEIDVDGRASVLHINSLRRYFDRNSADMTASTNMIIDESTVNDLTSSDDFWPETNRQNSSADERGDSCGGKDDYQMGKQLSPDQRDEMSRLLERYESVFCDQPGTTNLTEHVIRVTDDIPCYQVSYKIPDSMKDAVEQELANMLQNGVIQYDYDTKYNAPLIVVKKKNGGIRLVNNFINLNRKTINEQYIMSDPNDLIRKAAGNKYVTKIDLSEAYFSIPLSAESQHLTGFMTHLGPFSYRKMPQGLKCASATFQNLMHRVLHGMHSFSGTLIDDCVIFSADYKSHLKQVEMVLERLKIAGLSVNKSKCCFATNELKLFGHYLKDGLIYPDPEKVDAIAACQPPKTQKQLKSFLGTVGYFRDHINNFAKISYPLTQLIGSSKPCKLSWGEAHQKSFDALKTALTTSPVLHAPDIRKPYHLACDTSKVSISAILMQPADSDEKPDHVIAFASRKLKPNEQNLPVIERELLSIIWSLTKFRTYVYGCEILCFTDHRPLTWLNSLVKHSSRLARWALMLQDFNVTTTYVKGKDQIADSLTRL